ncbi:type II toxin-antitoxin system RelE/ParE family toxin [Parabacteroides sp.]
MDGRESGKPIITSKEFRASVIHIMDEGIERFGYIQAKRYLDLIEHSVRELEKYYPYHPECRHLATKSRMYRNIILDSHLIIYRITDEQIEVLDIVHSATSMRKIKKTRNIHIE